MRKLILGMACGAVALGAAQPANATVTIANGSQMSVGGNAQLNGGTNAATSTSVDFLVEPGDVAGAAPGTVTNYIGTGTFAGQSCSLMVCGSINDITSVSIGASATPLFTLIDGVTFSLLAITSIDTSSPDVLAFHGTGAFGGTLGGDALAYTPGTFVFTTQGGNLTTFSATAIAVPEPGTWALMLLGFSGIGMALRRRRRPVLAQLA